MKLIAAAAAITALMASTLISPAHAGRATPGETSYSCDGGGHSFTLSSLSRHRLRLVDGAGNTATLKPVESGSGDSYEGGGYELSLKGDEGMLVFQDKYRHDDCKIVNSAATQTTAYSCDDGGYSFTLTTQPGDRVKIEDGAGNTAVLERTESGSGESYEGNGYSLMLKGSDGLLIVDGKYRHEDCSITR